MGGVPPGVAEEYDGKNPAVQAAPAHDVEVKKMPLTQTGVLTGRVMIGQVA